LRRGSFGEQYRGTGIVDENGAIFLKVTQPPEFRP
jgi:hypothetical protein